MGRPPDKSTQQVSEVSETLRKILDCADSIRDALQVIDGLSIKTMEVHGFSAVVTSLEKMTVAARTIPLDARTAARRDAELKGLKKKG